MNVSARGGEEGGGGEDALRRRRRGRRGRRRRRSITSKTMATFGRMHVCPWALASMLTLWVTVAAAPERENSVGDSSKICGVSGAPPCNSHAAGSRAEPAAPGDNRRICGLPGAPSCKSSEEDSEEGHDTTYDDDIYGAYENLEYGEEQENATRVDGSIPVLEAFPILEPRPQQHPQMMLQEAPPFTWLVQSDTPPRLNKEPEGDFGADGDGNSLLGGLSGLKGRVRKGGNGGGRSKERMERSLKRAREKRES